MTLAVAICQVVIEVTLPEWFEMDTWSLWSEDSQELDPHEDSQAWEPRLAGACDCTKKCKMHGTGAFTETFEEKKTCGGGFVSNSFIHLNSAFVTSHLHKSLLQNSKQTA